MSMVATRRVVLSGAAVAVLAVALAASMGCRRKTPAETAPQVEIAPLKVLFIGNSYTYVNDLPASFRALAAAAGAKSVAVDSVTQGGATLEVMWGTKAPARIAEGGWTHVVLQGQSVEPCGGTENFLVYAAKFAAAAKAVGAVPVFYETWPRKAGDAIYSEPWLGDSPAAMQACLKSAYARAAADGGGVVAPAGDAWMVALTERPTAALYQSDGSHPSPAGTYLTAAVMLSVIAHASAVDVLWSLNGMTAADRDFLADVAVETAPPTP